MFEHLLSLIILFFVVIDPFMSMGIFFAATSDFKNSKRKKSALIAISVAIGLSLLFLFFGTGVLNVLQIKFNNFQIAGGIVLGLLGIQMSIGQVRESSQKFSHKNARAIAAVIGTPLLTGPATITTIIVSTAQYGILITGLAMLIIFALTYLLLLFSDKITNHLGPNITQVITTLLGIVTLSYGVTYIVAGLGL